MKMLLNILLALLLQFILVMQPLSANDNSDTSSDTDEVLLIGVEDNHYLPHYSAQNGDYRGFARDILDEFFAQTGRHYKYRPLPVARLLQSFIDGQVDFKYPDSMLWHAELKEGINITYSAPVVQYIDGISVLPKNKGRRINTLKNIGTLRGFSTPPWMFRFAEGSIQLLENDSFQGAVEQAIIGRIDGVYANIDVVNYFLAESFHKPNTLVFDDTMPYIRGYYRLATIKYPHVIASFNQWLSTNSATIGELKRKYHLENKRLYHVDKMPGNSH